MSQDILLLKNQQLTIWTKLYITDGFIVEPILLQQIKNISFTQSNILLF